MQNKRCSKCGEEKPLTKEFWKVDKRRKYGLATHMCKNCRREYRRSDAYREHERKRKQSDTYREYWREYTRKYQREYYHRSDSCREYMLEYSREYSSSMQDGYIIKCLLKQGITLKAITPEMLELKRQQLTMYRELRQLKKEVCNGTTGKGNTGTKESQKGLQNQED